MIALMGRLRRCALITLTLYWVTLFVGTHVPGSSAVVVSLGDKALHFIAYAGLGFLLACVISGRRAHWNLLCVVFAIGAIYGAIDELLQMPVPGRYADVFDWAADLLGLAFGMMGYVATVNVLEIFRSPVRSKRTRPPAEVKAG